MSRYFRRSRLTPLPNPTTILWFANYIVQNDLSFWICKLLVIESRVSCMLGNSSIIEPSSQAHNLSIYHKIILFTCLFACLFFQGTTAWLIYILLKNITLTYSDVCVSTMCGSWFFLQLCWSCGSNPGLWVWQHKVPLPAKLTHRLKFLFLSLPQIRL